MIPSNTLNVLREEFNIVVDKKSDDKNSRKENSTKEPAQESILGALSEKLDQWFSKIDQLVAKLTTKQSKVIPLFTYAAAIQYFVDERPEDERIEKGVILRQPRPEGFLIIQVFLDGKNSLVPDAKGQIHGRQLVVNKLDDELQEAFGNTSMILVE